MAESRISWKGKSSISMNLKNKNSSAFCFFLLLFVLALICEVGFCRESPERLKKMSMPGGLRTMSGNNGEAESMGRFAIQEHNKNQNTFLEFARVIEAKEQTVAGMMYHLTLEAVNGSAKEIYKAKVWVKPWMNFKQLDEFKQA